MENSKTVGGFIFDLDGVITDTAEYHFRSWKRLAEEEGIPFTREDNEALRGIPRRDSLMVLLKGRMYPEEKIHEMIARKNEYYVESIKAITPRNLLPGARELLDEILIAGVKIAIGSASKNARAVIEGLGIGALLEAIADGYSVERQKPAPDLFLFAAGELRLPAKECVVVEDAAAGIEAAKKAGFLAVGLGPPARVQGADAIFPSLENVHLADILKALNASPIAVAR